MEPPLPSQSIRGTTRILIFAVVTYLVWVFATWLLEGRILTLLRPEAVLDRVTYTIVANIIIGIVLALFVVRYAMDARIISFIPRVSAP